MKNIILIIFIFAISSTFAQIFDDMEIEDDSLIFSWIESNIENYEGVYFYGISEGESIVTLAIENEKIDLQISNSGKEIYYNGKFAGWERNIENYTNIKIKGNRFYSDQTNGEFVLYKKDGKEIKCLKLQNPPIDLHNGIYELGEVNRQDKETYFSGKYVSTKFDIINDDKLKSMTSDELKIMRNEIFARYGYKFKEGGTMETYFEKQKWYSKSNLDVNNCLTSIETENIDNIRRVNNEK